MTGEVLTPLSFWAIRQACPERSRRGSGQRSPRRICAQLEKSYGSARSFVPLRMTTSLRNLFGSWHAQHSSGIVWRMTFRLLHMTKRDISWWAFRQAGGRHLSFFPTAFL